MGATKKSAKETPDASSAGASPAFDAVVAALHGLAGGEAPSAARREFGANGLKVNGKIFAMVVRGALVVKLPKERVDALVGSGEAERFDPGRGKPMKEWASLRGSEEAWLDLAREARQFVAGGRG
jgi:TfoX/Sxy family transcriptional regulator of competence genes